MGVLSQGPEYTIVTGLNSGPGEKVIDQQIAGHKGRVFDEN